MSLLEKQFDLEKCVNPMTVVTFWPRLIQNNLYLFEREIKTIIPVSFDL